MQDDAVGTACPVEGIEPTRATAMVAKRRLGIAVAVGGGRAGVCTRNVRGDRAPPRLGRFFRLRRPLIFSLSLTVLTNLVQTVEVDVWTKTVMADISRAVVTLVLLLPAGQ